MPSPQLPLTKSPFTYYAGIHVQTALHLGETLHRLQIIINVQPAVIKVNPLAAHAAVPEELTFDKLTTPPEPADGPVAVARRRQTFRKKPAKWQGHQSVAMKTQTDTAVIIPMKHNHIVT